MPTDIPPQGQPVALVKITVHMATCGIAAGSREVMSALVDELSQANNDINNLLASTEIGTIFLDTNLRIKRFTPAMTKLFNLIPSDIDRPISDITSNIQYDNLYAEAKALRMSASTSVQTIVEGVA